jgi:hypothetical protein
MRTGFDIEQFNNFEFDLNMPTGKDGEVKAVKEKYFCIVVRKARPLDIK